MTEQEPAGHRPIVVRLLLELLLPALGFGLGVGFATGNFPAALATGLAISLLIYVLYRLDLAFIRPRLEQLPRDWLRLGLEMTFSLLEHLAGALVALLVCSRLFGFSVVPTAAWGALGGLVVAFPIIHGTETALRYYRQLKEKEEREKELRALTTEAELKALKAQINPHFLFNTLNTIAQLIHTNATQAEVTIERLAEILRYTLAGSEQATVPLKEELAFVDTYLEIEQARFGRRLQIGREIAPGTLEVPIPVLLLQPLVENAIRHGQGPNGRVDLHIRVRRQEDAVIIAIADQGPGMPPHYQIGEGPGVGLRNVDQRLRKHYGEGYRLEIRDNEPRGTIALLRIPGEITGPATAASRAGRSADREARPADSGGVSARGEEQT